MRIIAAIQAPEAIRKILDCSRVPRHSGILWRRLYRPRRTSPVLTKKGVRAVAIRTSSPESSSPETHYESNEIVVHSEFPAGNHARAACAFPAALVLRNQIPELSQKQS